MLLPPILKVPDAVWVLRMVQRIATAALTPARIDFEELLPLAVRGVLAAAATPADGRARRQRTAAGRRRRAGPEAGAGRFLVPPFIGAPRRSPRFSAWRARRDGVARAARRRVQPAEGFCGISRALGADAGRKRADRGAGRPECVRRRAESATAAAHRIQDYQFCLQVTSMVNAIKRRWATIAPAGLAATIARFSRTRPPASSAPFTSSSSGSPIAPRRTSFRPCPSPPRSGGRRRSGDRGLFRVRIRTAW